jgi:hypothetical protein
MRDRKRILVYPCGTEMALEIYKAVEYSTHFELWGGSSNYDHGQYVYTQYIGNLPFITDISNVDEILEFQSIIDEYEFDYIYPAMDGVLYKFSQYSENFNHRIIAPDFTTAKITRSKKLTYELMRETIAVPEIYKDIDRIKEYPVFIKPDIGQGSINARRVDNIDILQTINLDGMLIMENIPGNEYTVDCFTNNSGNLIYISPRNRKRIKNGISVCSDSVNGEMFTEIAEKINRKLNQRGGWFFQLKENKNRELVLLEVASRIAGTSAYTRIKGVNLPLLTLFLYSGNEIDHVVENKYEVVIDRALYNSYATNLYYDKVYIDYDDTVIFNGKINIKVITFLYQCINNNIPIVLLTKHLGDIIEDLTKYRIQNIFDEIIHIEPNEDKYRYVTGKNSIFIDDSFSEREQINKKCCIPVFDVHAIEFLLNPLDIRKV